MPNFPTRIATLSLIALAAGACTARDGADMAAAQAGDRQCFLPRQVSGFSSVDDETVHVTVGANNVYALEVVGVCPDIDWSQRIGIRARGGGSTWVCQGLDAEIIVPSPSGTQTCPVTAVRRLSDAEVQAWRDRDD